MSTCLRLRVLVGGVLCLVGCSPEADRPNSGTSATAFRSEAVQPGQLAIVASSLDSIIARGESKYLEGDFDAARSVWLAALRQVGSLRDSVAEPRLLTWLGLAAWRQGQYGEARQLGEKALALKLRRGLNGELSRSYNALGLLAWNEGRLEAAASLFGDAIRAARAQQDDEGVAKGSGNLGLVHTELGEFGDARQSFLAARIAGQSLGNARIEGNALNNLGMLEIRIGDARSAIAPLQEARRLYHSIRYATGEQNALGQLATAYATLGRPQDAFAVLDSALRIAREQGLQQEEASNLQILAELFEGAGDPQRALRYYQQAQVLNARLGLQVEAGTISRRQAATYAALGNLQQARSQALEALDAHRTAGARLEELNDLLLLAEITHQAKRLTEVSAYVGAARHLARKLDTPVGRTSLALTAGRIADRDRQPARVIRALDQAQPDLARGDYASEWEGHALRSRALAQMGLLDSAVVVGRRAVGAVERVRSAYASGVLRTAYTSDKAGVYADLVLLLLRLNRVEEAFTVADAARGRAMIEHLSGAGEAVRQQGDVQALNESEKLLRRINALLRVRSPTSLRKQGASTNHCFSGQRGIPDAPHSWVQRIPTQTRCAERFSQTKPCCSTWSLRIGC